MGLDSLVEIPQTMLAFMNEDHRVEVELLRDLVKALRERVKGAGSDAEVLPKLAALEQHTREHFAREEQAMVETDFPPYPEHRAEHARLLAELAAKVAEYRTGGSARALLQYADEGLTTWFVGHVTTMDFVTARFVTAQRGH